MATIDIQMSAEDWMVAATKGAIRQLQAIKQDRMGKDHGSTSQRGVSRRLGDSILGELGEMATARALHSIQTSFFESLRAADIAGRYEVRTTDRDDGCLLLHRTSPDDAIYVLAVVQGLTVSLRGWIQAKDGKKGSNWRRGDPGCFFVPQSDLHPMAGVDFGK